MKKHVLVGFLGVFLVLGLIAAPAPSYAEIVDIKAKAPPAKKKQKFKLKQKAKFNFDKKFGTDNKPSFGDKVKMKPGNDPVTGKKKPAAAFNLGELMPTSQGGHNVSIELVALSLTSVNQVSLAPFGKQFSKQQGQITLNLLQTSPKPAPGPKAKAKVTRLDKNKKKGVKKFSDLKKDLKVSAKVKDSSGAKKKKSKQLATLSFAALDIPFTFASPVSIIDPGFCMDSRVTDANGNSAQGAEICLAPIPNPVPIPGALGLFGIGLASLVLVKFNSRRRKAAI